MKSIQNGSDVKDFAYLFFELKIPLHEGYSLSSIKKTMNTLQLEVQNGDKRRVLFIDPRDISHHDLLVKKISHKPPQCLSSCVGNDLHEKYHTGLPFTSDRKANFSSNNIPLFSSTVDNFRGNIKKAKQNSLKGKYKKTIMNVLDAIDPGVRGFYSTVLAMHKSAATKNKKNNKQNLYDKNIKILSSHSEALLRVANDALGTKPGHNFSEALMNLTNEIKPRDVLHLNSSNRIAAFFGIASGGVPFAPGWFAGARCNTRRLPSQCQF